MTQPHSVDPEQELCPVEVPVLLGALGPVAFSELVRDLEALRPTTL